MAEPTVAASTVATKMPPLGIPETARMSGFTARMYAMVMNVIRPASISVWTFVPFSRSLKNFSSISYFLLNRQ